MLMLPGATFTGNSGITYTAVNGVSQEIGGGDVRQALIAGWSEITYPLTNSAALLSPLTAFTYNVPDGVTALVLTPAGTIATGTIKLPPNPTDNTPFRCATSQTVTSLTVSANTGQTLVGAPTTITAIAPFEVFYNLTNATWYRR